MGLNWNFQRGGDSNQKNLLWEGYGYFLEQHFTLGVVQAVFLVVGVFGCNITDPVIVNSSVNNSALNLKCLETFRLTVDTNSKL